MLSDLLRSAVPTRSLVSHSIQRHSAHRMLAEPRGALLRPACITRGHQTDLLSSEFDFRLIIVSDNGHRCVVPVDELHSNGPYPAVVLIPALRPVVCPRLQSKH